MTNISRYKMLPSDKMYSLCRGKKTLNEGKLIENTFTERFFSFPISWKNNTVYISVKSFSPRT
uniref:Uncharacterized protein n=1 Tax=Anguilla anguilla TaxID=7936 RepID=A0A0E9X260_ANGAN